MKNVAFSCCCFVAFCKQRQTNEERILRHAYTAIILVAVAQFNSLKSNKWPKNEQPNEHKTNERPANKKTAGSAENISAMERNQSIDNGIPAFRLLQLRAVHASRD